LADTTPRPAAVECDETNGLQRESPEQLGALPAVVGTVHPGHDPTPPQIGGIVLPSAMTQPMAAQSNRVYADPQNREGVYPSRFWVHPLQSQRSRHHTPKCGNDRESRIRSQHDRKEFVDLSSCRLSVSLALRTDAHHLLRALNHPIIPGYKYS
jgi:hypothetical protein